MWFVNVYFQCTPREFKRFDFSRFPGVEDAYDNFVERVYEFSFGCLNARLNGTLYFGVEDGPPNSDSHGTIRGNVLTPDDMNKLQELLEVHLTSKPCTVTFEMEKKLVHVAPTKFQRSAHLQINYW